MAYRAHVQWSQEDNCYVAEALALENCKAHGQTPEAALEALADAVQGWLDVAKEKGYPIPPEDESDPGNKGTGGVVLARSARSANAKARIGRSIVITSGKGGVGKTTACANLGTAIALLGRTVAIVDADIGLRNLDVVMGLESRVVYTSMDVIEGKCDLSKALIRDKRAQNLFVLAAAQSRNKSDIRPEQMQKLVKELETEHDFVLIDCPAGIEQGFDNAVAGAGEAVVVVTPEVSSIRDADRVIGLLQSKGLSQPSYLLNRLSQRMVEKGEMLSRQDVQEILAIPLLGVIPEDGSLIGSTNRGKPLALEGATPAAAAFLRIARRLMGEEVPIPEFRHETPFGRFWKTLWGRG